MAGTRRQAAIGFIFITLLLDVIGLGIIYPVIPTLIEELIGGGLSKASLYGGIMMFSYALMQFIFAPVLGGLSDRYGRRPILLVSLLGFAAGYVIMATSATFTWLVIGRVVTGLFGASIATGAAYIADISPPEKRAQNFGLIGVAFGLGFIIGPALGGVLGEYGSRVPFYVSAGLTLLNWVYGLTILPESLAKENRRKFDFRRANPLGTVLILRRYPQIAPLVGALALVYIAGFAVQGVWSFHGMYKFEWDEMMVGLSLGVVGIFTASVQGGLIRVVIPKFGQLRALKMGLTFMAFGLLLFAFAPSGTAMIAFSAVYALGGIAGPSFQGLLTNEIPNNEQGEFQSALTSLRSLTSIIGLPLMTSVFSYFTSDVTNAIFPGAPFLLAAIILCAALAVVLRFARRTEGAK